MRVLITGVKGQLGKSILDSRENSVEILGLDKMNLIARI